MVAEPLRLKLRVSFQKLSQYMVCIRDHTPELEAIESLTITPDSAVTKYNRTPLSAQEDRNGQDQGKEYDTQKYGAYDIKHSLEGVSRPVLTQ
jgi:hypothetical protein